jgi:histone-lysine N-methyltransferase SUV39H
VRARVAIPKGTYLGMYSGELITDNESERRGHLYNDIGRTYLFDLDGYQISHPPPIAKLRKVDPRLAYLAEQTLEKVQAAGIEEDEGFNTYSGESGVREGWEEEADG